MAPAQVVRWIKQAYPKPVVNSEWLDSCCEWVANELHLNPDTQSQAFNVEVENQLLESDLRDSTETGTGLPRNVSAMNNERIRGTPVLVEVTAIMEIGHSAFNLHNVRQARIERADLAGLAQEEGVEDDEGPVPNYPKSMLKLTLCDGTVTIPAIEYRSIPGLKLDETPLGYKILLKDVLVRRGIIFLEPQGIVLKGHSNSERDEHRDRDFVRGLLKRMLKPIPTEEQPPNDDNNDENHPPPRASPHRPPAQRAAAQEQVRSPLREVSEPPEPRPDGMDMDDEADLPRKRRIPNLQQQQPLASSAVSSSSTLVASRFFSGSSNASSSSETNAITQRLARVLSPVRGDPIDITDSSMEDAAPPPRVTPTPGPASGSRSTSAIATTSGKQQSGPGPGSGSKTLRSKISYEEFEFDDEDDEELDAAFLAEIAKVEKEALVNQNQRVAQAVAQSRAASRAASEAPKARDARELTPLPWLPVYSPKSASSSPANASVPAPAPARRPQPKPSLSATAREEVILIEDEEDDDKENVPVPKRRVRRRVSAMPDDVIDISD